MGIVSYKELLTVVLYCILDFFVINDIAIWGDLGVFIPGAGW